MTRLLRRYLRPYATPIVGVLILLLVQAIGNLYLPTLQGDIINEGVSKGDTDYIASTGIFMLVVTFVRRAQRPASAKRKNSSTAALNSAGSSRFTA